MNIPDFKLVAGRCSHMDYPNGCMDCPLEDTKECDFKELTKEELDALYEISTENTGGDKTEKEGTNG